MSGFRWKSTIPRRNAATADSRSPYPVSTSTGVETPLTRMLSRSAMPGVPARGIRTNSASTQAQVAATIAALLGEDFTRAEPRAAAPLALRD